MLFRPGLHARATRPGFWPRAALGLAVLALLAASLGGCRLLEPRAIRQLLRAQGAQARFIEQNHLATPRDYAVNGRTIHYVAAGAGGAVPLVLFIHGSPGDWQAWARYLADPDLRARARLIAVDRPGFGGSSGGGVERSLERQSQDLAPLLGLAAPGQRVILVGHSFGGPVACRLAMDHPDAVTDLILLAGSIDPGQEHTKWYQYVAEWPGFRCLVPASLAAANREIRPLKAGLTAMLPLWPALHQRVTVIQGLSDNLVPPENASFAGRELTGARSLQIIRLPGVNHFLPWNQYPLVKAVILQHLR